MSVADSTRAPLLTSMRRRLGGARRIVEESVLRRPVSTAFARYLAKNFGQATVEEVRGTLQFLRAFDGQTLNGQDLRSVPALARAAAALREAASRAGRPTSVNVSIVIPVHNNVAHTLMCLASVFRRAPRRAFEVIVGDDASGDATGALVGALGGPVVYLRPPRFERYSPSGNSRAHSRRRPRHRRADSGLALASPPSP